MNFSSIHIEGAELMNVGQATDKGESRFCFKTVSFIHLSYICGTTKTGDPNSLIFSEYGFEFG